jgi:mersacidin/lichenicidin family type 2 lantibiotic
MKKIDIVRAWKDSSYFESLSADEKAMVPANPAGALLSDDQLSQVRGAFTSASCTGGGTCCTTQKPKPKPKSL